MRDVLRSWLVLTATALGALIIGAASRLLNSLIGSKGKVETADYIHLKQRRGRWE